MYLLQKIENKAKAVVVYYCISIWLCVYQLTAARSEGNAGVGAELYVHLLERRYILTLCAREST
jgi:hypothetical protein